MNHEPRAVRLIHLSDIHVTRRPLGWQRADWFTKRLPGWLNLRWLGRGKRFRHASTVLTRLMKEVQDRPPDRLLFTGDATALGFEAELAHAAELFGLHKNEALPGLAVPGNHDYYTPAMAGSGLFERYFATWQQGERVDGATYPFAQRVGPAWLVALNSSVANRHFWDASGYVDAPQLARLAKLLESLAPGPRVLVTHYPVCLADGRPERRDHGLRNLAEVVAVAQRGGISLWLHGHRHHAYHLQEPPLASFPILCAGSATQSGLWSYGDYTLEERRLFVVRRVYDPDRSIFTDQEAFTLNLPG
jgi:3',5'-cyclic AMP phosphodiesterase CpdA